MKKLLSLLIAVLFVFSVYAEGKVLGTYYNSATGRSYNIEEFGSIGINIGVKAKFSKQASLSVDNKDIASFKSALESVRNEYCNWCKLAKGKKTSKYNNKEFGVSFPIIGVMWLGSKWVYERPKYINFRFRVLNNGKMIATAEIEVSSNGRKDTLYFNFASKKDFDNLISKL